MKNKQVHQIGRERNTYLMYTSLLLVEFSTGELKHNPLVRMREKHNVNKIRTWVQSLLRSSYGNTGASKKEIDKAETLGMEHVAHMAEAMAMLSVVPHAQLEQVLDQFNAVCKEACKRASSAILEER